MKDTDEMDAAVRFIRPQWTQDHTLRSERAVRARLRARTRGRRAAVGVLVAGVAATVMVLRRSDRALDSQTNGGAGRTGGAIRLADGTVAEPIDVQARLELAEASDGRQVVRVVRGGGRFDVRPSSRRVFRVEIRDVAVEVLGTAFTAEEEGARVRVAVQRGKVQVHWSGRTSVLVAGDTALFPPDAPSRAPASQPKAPARSSQPFRHWRSLADQGQYDAAYRELRSEGPAAVSDEPSALLLAADVARLSRHPAEAVDYLRRLLDRYPRDSKAQLAAFTLGRLYLEDLDQARDAARAFGRARALDPAGELVEDALAREVEAWHRGGDRDRARARAQEYLDRYREGHRIDSVRRFGGIE